MPHAKHGLRLDLRTLILVLCALTALVMLCESLLIRSQPVIGALFRSFSMIGKRLPAEQKQALKEQLAAIPGL